MPPFSQEVPKPARIQRGPEPGYELNDSNVATAKPFLLRDSGGRCAYSMIHEREIGKETIEVDHFDPRKLGGKKNHSYDNLLPAFGPCNRSKSDKWPSAAAEVSGARFLNASVEQDYGVHLFEDPESHRIVAVTTAGKYHLRYLNLNTECLVLKRKNRSIAKRLRDNVPLMQGLSAYDAGQLDDLLGNAESAIPEIDPPPAQSPYPS
jgi:5-methylcytosine-specific restriction endonuclease McrA